MIHVYCDHSKKYFGNLYLKNINIKGNPAVFLEALCRLTGTDIPRTRHMGTSFFKFPLSTAMVELTFGHCQIKEHACAFFQDFLSWKGTLDFRTSKWLEQKFRNEAFFGYLTLFRDKNPGWLHVALFQFSPRPRVRPIIIFAIENMTPDILFAVSKRHSLPTQRH